MGIRFFLGILAIAALSLAASGGAPDNKKPQPDFAQAMTWLNQDKDERALAVLRDLARASNADAEAVLGTLYAKGRGVPADPATAAIWFYRAARQGHAAAQLALATLYLQGVGVARDPTTAYRWLLIAARYGSGAVAERAQTLLTPLAAEIPADDREQAQSDAQGWRPVYALGPVP